MEDATERRKATFARYYQNHREAILEKRKAYDAAHKERRAELARIRRATKGLHPLNPT